MIADKAALLATRNIGTQVVEVEGFGSVKVRGVTRAEVLAAQQAGATDAAAMERKLLASALVDPAMTEDEVGQWQTVSPAGELLPVTEAVEQLSGLAAKAVKAEMQKFR